MNGEEGPSIEFELAGYGSVCSGPRGCGAFVARDRQEEHRRFHRTVDQAAEDAAGRWQR